MIVPNPSQAIHHVDKESIFSDVTTKTLKKYFIKACLTLTYLEIMENLYNELFIYQCIYLYMYLVTILHVD